MSGRDHEPIAAFFPPIDRNLIRDLDRHLRGAQSSAPVLRPAQAFEQDTFEHNTSEHDTSDHQMSDLEASNHETLVEDATERTSQHVPQPASPPAHLRPSTTEVLEAVQQAASSMASMGARIHELESRQRDLEAINGQLRNKLGEMLQLQQSADARARAESERAAQAEEIAAQHLTRAQTLESDLEAALGDLHRIAEAITGTLAVQHSR